MSELERRTPLKRSGGLRRTPMKRSPAKERRTLSGGQVEAARERKRERRATAEFSEKTKRRTSNAQGRRCALTGGPIECYHHRQMKSAGGRGIFENCLGLTHEAHRLIHDETDWAYRHGLLVRRAADPRRVEPVTGCELLCEVDHVGQ